MTKHFVLPLIAFTVLAVSTPLRAAERTLILSDNFERSESQEKKDEPGNGWSTNSAWRAGGNKQVDLKNGAMYIFMHKDADHAVSVRHDAEFKNGEVEVRFKLENAKDVFTLNFADAKLKTVHAGHLFKVTTSLKKLEIADLKTGVMDLEIRKARMAGELTSQQKKMLTTKKKSFPVKLQQGEWVTLKVNITGDTITTHLDGKPAGSFQSAGFAHPQKRMLRLSVPRQAVVDDLKIFALAP